MGKHFSGILQVGVLLAFGLSLFACGQEKSESSGLAESSCDYSRWTNCLIDLDQIDYRPGDTDLTHMAEYNRKRTECRRLECR